jgi:hypothetical protein
MSQANRKRTTRREHRDAIYRLIDRHTAAMAILAQATAKAAKLEQKLKRRADLGYSDLTRPTAPFAVKSTTKPTDSLWFDTLDEFAAYLSEHFASAAHTALTFGGDKAAAQAKAAKEAVWETGLAAAIKATSDLRRKQKASGWLDAIAWKAKAQTKETAALLKLCRTNATSPAGAQSLAQHLSNEARRFATDETGKAVLGTLCALTGALGMAYAGREPNNIGLIEEVIATTKGRKRPRQPRRTTATKPAIRKAA